MDSEGCSVSSSNSSSSSAAVETEAEAEMESGAAAADRLGRVEMEAAEALAGLAHLAMRENGSGGKWGSKGKRGMKRVKSESPLDDSGLNLVVDSVPTGSDFATDQMHPDKQHDQPFCGDVVINPANVETPKENFSSVNSHPSLAVGRSRQNLTEDEKEERRIRRILANRESARQTIRRRQALCEELTRKAADLAWENESLKREKELALKEYQSLESKNKHLKEQTTKLIKSDKEDSSGSFNSTPVDKCPTSSPNRPIFLYNQPPFPPLCWPSIIQSSNGPQSNHGPQNAVVIPPNISLPLSGKPDSAQQQKENAFVVNGAQTPLYILSCPWFFPLAEQPHGLNPQSPFGLKHNQEGMSLNDQYSTNLSSKAENDKVKSEAVINDLNEMPAGFSPDGGGEYAVHHPKGTSFSGVALGFVQATAAMKSETGNESEFAPYTDGICTESWQRANALPGNQDCYDFSSRRLVDAAAAAEARKRRKELTKLKNLHGRQCKMNC